VRPDERADGSCGKCGKRRLGDDLNLEQLVELTQMMTARLPEEDDRRPMYTTVRNRTRPRTVRHHL
jgi:hypothetical protein